MENIFTPEEANMSVTYGALADILKIYTQNLVKETADYVDITQEGAFKIIKKLTDSLVEMRKDLDYLRQRDMHFIINYLAREKLCNRDTLFDIYRGWCDEFDKLNKPQKGEEKKDG